MIFSKLSYFAKRYQSTTIIIRRYSKPNFQPLMMPRDNKQYMSELQRQRKRIKAQSAKYTPSNVYIQVIGHGSRAESRSVLLCTDHTHYLFNCGEGTQRLATEHHAKLTKIEHIFVTKTTWENMGGIPGTALTIQDTGVSKLNLHGPDGTIDIIDAIENFVVLNELTFMEADTSKQFSDQCMTVTYVPIENPKKSEEDSVEAKLFVDSINYYQYYDVNANGKRPRSPNTAKNGITRTKVVEQKSRIRDMMIYVCKLHPKAGTLNVEKCAELGVTPGPNLGKLKAGEDITLSDGTIVRSADVVSAADPGPVFIVMECSDEDWIDVITQNPTLLKHQQETALNPDEVASYIIHFTPKSVLNNPKYKEWMKKFGPKTQHLIINEENTGISSESMYKMQHQLHILHPTIFPFFGDKQCFANQTVPEQIQDNFKEFLKNMEVNLESNESNESEVNKNEDSAIPLEEGGPLIHHCQTLHSVHLRPHKGLDISAAVQIHPKEYIQEMFAIDGFLDALAELQTSVSAKTQVLGDTAEYPRLLMLGTGSSIPNKVRNTSGMLLQLDEDRSIVLDCGEATVSQIIRFFGEEEADLVLKSIKAIYVSHLHADHHLGFIGILKQRKRVTDEPVFLLAPQQMSSYLHYYHHRFEPIVKQFRLVSNRDLLLNQAILSPLISKDLYQVLDVANISTSFVKHCPYSYGVAITLKDGRKISYSGDTVPCESFMKLARDSFLMIHEATMEDGLENEALVKRHSTISQAVNVGIKAEVNFTLLTHFSQRYSKIPLLPSKTESNIDFSRVGIAYDFMMISLSKLTLLSLFYPSLALMFSEFRAMLDERASRREWKKGQLIRSVKN